MDISAVVDAVKGVVSFIVESGIIDKLVELVKQAVPYVVELVGSIAAGA